MIALFEFTLAACVLLILGTQIIIPLIRHTKLFPFFNNEHNLVQKKAELKQALVEEDLHDEVKELEETLKLRKSPEDDKKCNNDSNSDSKN